VLLRAVELRDFRNLASAQVEPHPRFTVFSGDNGQGKTNLLEGIFLAATLKSFRAGSIEELIRFGAGEARVRARLERSGLERIYEVELGGTPARKAALVDGKRVRAAAEHFGGFNVVLFAVEDLQLPRGAPGPRRRFLDRAVWNAEPQIAPEARAYQRALKQKNALLRDLPAPREIDALLDAYDAQLALEGARIVARRRRYLRELEPRFHAAFARIALEGHHAELGYESALAGPEEGLAAELGARLAQARPRDRARGYSSVGPHADDLAIGLDGRPAASHASQGQLRALVLALKIAEIELLEARLGEHPVLLLDDVSSELDAARNAALFAFLREVQCQVLITTTHRSHVPIDGPRSDFLLVAGVVTLA
jgi:DNA replication and repair protein RecF